MYDNMDEHAVVSTNFSTGEEVTAMPSFVNYVEGIYVATSSTRPPRKRA